MISFFIKYRNPILITTVVIFLASIGILGAGIVADQYSAKPAEESHFHSTWFTASRTFSKMASGDSIRPLASEQSMRRKRGSRTVSWR